MTYATITAADRSADGTIVVGVVGDSISAGTPDWDPDPAVLAAIERPLPESTWVYWAAQQDPRLEFRVTAVDGERTDEIATRMDLVLDGLDAIVVQGGINDLVQGRGPEAAAAGLRPMVRRARELGLPVAVPEILPWNVGYPAHEAPIRRLNALIHEIAQQEGATVLPFHDTLEDPDIPGKMRPDWTVDGSHPSVEGHRRLGTMAFTLPTAEGAR